MRKVVVETAQNKETYKGGRKVHVDKYDILEVTANRRVEVEGTYVARVKKACPLQQAGTETIFLDGHIVISSTAKIELIAPGCSVKMEDGAVAIHADNEIAFSTGSSTVRLKSDGTIEAEGGTKVAVSGGGAMGEWTSNGVKQTGNMVEIGADAVCTIQGTMVKIN